MPEPDPASPAAERPVRWTDHHCHLPAGADEAQAWLAAAAAAGVERVVTVGTDLPSSAEARTTARAHPGRVRATAGVHPHDASTLFGVDGRVDADRLAELEALVAEPEVVAVGECGLDYHYDHSPRDQQREVFAAQIDLAHRTDLPLVIHTREAWDDTFAILAAEGVPRRTVLHCFTGGPDEARRCLDLGALLSFSGIVTFPSAPEVREAAALCPLDRLLVETDSPYLAPVPHRGRPNRPAFVPLVGAAVAEVKGVAVDELAAATWAATSATYGW
ncbi:MAG: TatD family hydrolase [Acidimicrobiales bacterium]